MKTCIWGFGISGKSAFKMLRNFYLKCDIIDKKLENEHLLYLYERIILSPGIPLKNLKLKKLEENKKTIIPEIELPLDFIKGKIIAITGTNGKTTTCRLIYNILENSGIDEKIYLAGNIGKPLSDFTFKKGIFVTEVSSFQLHFVKKLKPYIACILNISEDHMDSHNSFEEYIQDKLKLAQNLDKNSYLILNYDDKILRNFKKETNILYVSLKEKVRGVYYTDRKFIVNINGKNEEIKDEFNNLIGIGNKYNIGFSILVGYILGIDKGKIIEGIRNTEPMPHRLETVKEGDILWINDSKSTNPHSVLNALKSFDVEKKIILILGGKNKFLDFSIIEEEMKRKVKILITFGEAKEILRNTFEKTVPVKSVITVKDAVILSKQIAEKGDIILFSPGLSSFDSYKNYAERGEDFKKWVKEIS